MPELPRQPEVNVGELMATINSLRWEDGEQFFYNGSEYHYISLREEEIDPVVGPVWYARSSEDARVWDVYVLDTLPEADRVRMVFHEMLECNLKDQGFGHEEVHGLALEQEEKQFGKR